MRKEYNKNATIAGISKRNREFLDKLNRETKASFSIGEAAKFLI